MIVGASAGLGYSIGGFVAAVDAANPGEAVADLVTTTVSSVMSTLRKWGNTLAGKLIIAGGSATGHLQGEESLEPPPPVVEETKEEGPSRLFALIRPMSQILPATDERQY